MNDREQLEDLKRQASGQPARQPPTQDAVEQYVQQQAYIVRFYYQALRDFGFTHEDALYLAANAKLM